MKYLQRFLFVLVFALLHTGSFAQINSPALQDPIKFSPNDSDKLILSFNNLNFLKDNEYFGDIATGYTLFGSDLTPELAYVPNKYMRIQGGIFLRKDFGNPDFTTIAPVLTLKLQKNGYSFLFGNLEGCLNHQLIEPIFNYERIVTNRLENGIQFKIDKKKLWLDAWIDWMHQEYWGSNYQEHIVSGLSSRITLLQANVFKLQMPIQFLVAHFGGQIDSDPNPLSTLMDAAAGLSFDWNFAQSGSFISEIKSEDYGVLFNDASPTPLQQYKEGNGTYLNLFINTKYHVGLLASYWNGNDYIAPLGGFLYQSISSIPQNYARGEKENNRQLVLLHLLYMHELLPHLYMDVRFSPYYDLNQQRLEYAYSVFATYKRDFTLKKIDPRR